MRQILVLGPEARGQADSTFEELSPSQMQVLALLANAYPNKLIARELGISESTVKVHVKAILRKTGARNRTDVALRARGLAAEGNDWVDAPEQPSAEVPDVGAKPLASGGLARNGEGYVEDLQLRRQELQYRARRGREQDAVLRG
jgi:DNA-binding CsgD family transcriptional regulator